MDREKVRLISTVLVALGAIFIFMMAFNALPARGNALLFTGLVCFILAGAIRSLFKEKK